jgi:hypothetical protein
MGEEGGGVEEETVPLNQFSFPHFSRYRNYEFFSLQNFRFDVSSVAETFFPFEFRKSETAFHLISCRTFSRTVISRFCKTNQSPLQRKHLTVLTCMA